MSDCVLLCAHRVAAGSHFTGGDKFVDQSPGNLAWISEYLDI